jgi:hypothetical protein
MGFMSCIGTCVRCELAFTFNPERVPSVRVRWENGKAIPDSNGEREPICQPCFAHLNMVRVERGQKRIPLLPGAYEAEEVA